jgi:hypothetical protein
MRDSPLMVGVDTRNSFLRCPNVAVRASARAIGSGTLGHEITPAQVVLCLLDLKLARLAHDPTHEDSAVDVCGYAALLRELTETSNTEGQ